MEEFFNLSNPQKSILLIENFYKNTPINNICGDVLFNEKINIEILGKAINNVIKTNDNFRINFSNKNGNVMQYISDYHFYNFEILNLKNTAELRTIEKKMIKKIFPIYNSDLFEFKLFNLEDGHSGFILNIHHLISDAWSLNLLPQKIQSEYNKLINNIELKDNEIKNDLSYINYANEQQKYLSSVQYEKDENYWLNLYKDFSSPLSIPSDLPQTESQSILSSSGYRTVLSIPRNKMVAINSFCAQNHITVFNFLISIYSIYFSKISMLNDFTIGTPIFNRTNHIEKNIMGMFVNIVPYKISVDNSLSFKDLSIQLGKNTISLLRHQKFPYEKILEELRKKDSNIPNLYNIVLSYQINKQYENTEHNYSTNWVYSGHINEDLNIHFFDFDKENFLNVAYDYKKLKYSKSYIKNMHSRILNIISQVIKDENIVVKDIEILTEKEKNNILYNYNNTYLRYDKTKNILDYFLKNVSTAPNKVAVICDKQKLTYIELHELSNKLANHLNKKGIKKGSVVGIATTRSLELAVSLLAVIKLGATYLPLDLTYPEERVKYILENSNAKIVLVNLAKNNIPNEINKINVSLSSEIYTLNTSALTFNTKISLEDNIYLIYTSGSTGKPKGVLLKHQNISNFLKGTKKIIHLNKSKVMLSVTTICFDIFVLEFWGSLTNGMTLVLATDEEQNNAELLNKLCLENNVTIMQTTPSRYQALIQNKEYIKFFEKLTDILVGGEPLPSMLVTDLNSITKAKIYNMYGPTETAVWSTIKEIKSPATINIGKPIANTKCYILNNTLNLLPNFVPGDLYIGGDGVSNGYLNREELTKEKFINSPFDNSIIYNTGDLAYFNGQGELVHLGRNDFQVKIRGYRIELGEIENRISTITNIKNIAVIPDANKRYLICYYLNDTEIDQEKVNSKLLKDLPNYMIPSKYNRLDKFPLTPNGKLDRKKLPQIEDTIKVFEKVSTNTEKILYKVISEIIQNTEFDINTPFMVLGIDSLGIINIQAKLIQYNYSLTTQDFYKYNTIKSLAAHIDRNIYTYTEENAQVPSEFRHTPNEFIEKSSEKTYSDETLGNVFLTGANGFIGIHILHELLETTNVNIYCLVRKSSKTPEERLIETYNFYFDDEITDLINKRIFVISGTITDENIGLTQANTHDIIENVTTIIHTAAVVKHYGNYDEFQKTNVNGTKNIAEFAFTNGKRLIHISSISVSGNYLVKQDNRNILFSENSLYIGQKYNDNVYVHSKFEAEKIVLEYMKKGLTAQIHRIGILSGRYSDGVFQKNINENAFYSRIKSMVNLKIFSKEMLEQKIEFTPVDICVKNIVLLAKNHITDDRIFHLFNHNFIKVKDIIEILNEFGKNIQIVSQEEFNETIKKLSQEGNTKALFGIINDLDSNNSINYNFSVNIKSTRTQLYLKELKSSWNKTDKEYLRKIIKYMIDLNFI